MTDQDATHGARGSRPVFLFMAVLLLAGTVIIYLPALRGGFIWDDDVHFTGNSEVIRGRGIIDIWTSRRAMYYPLTLTTGWGLHKLFGFDPFVFHAVNLAFHAAAALLLLAVLRGLAIPGAWLAVLLFAWHPMQVETAAWITELKNTQSGFFMMLSVYAIMRSGFFERPFPSTRTEKWWFRISVALYVLAVLSKTSVVMLPAALAVMVWWKRGIRRWADIDGLFAYLVISLLAAGWTVWEQRYQSGAHGFEWALTLPERLALAGQTASFYIGKFIWPHPVMFIYPKWPVQAGSPAAWLPLLAWGAVLFLLVRFRRRGAAAAALTYLALVFPVAGLFNVYFTRYAWVADHFVYLASIPVFAAAGAYWYRLFARQRTAALAVAVAVIAACGWISHRHAGVFSGPEALWTDTLRKNPGAWMAHNNMGLLLRNAGDQEGAERKFLEALEHNPEHYEAMNNLGTLYQSRGESDRALAMFDHALSLRPELYQSWINRGVLLKGMGEAEEAYASFDRAAALRPYDDSVWVNIALLAEAQGDGPRAFRAFTRLLENKRADAGTIGGFLYERAYLVAGEGRPDVALFYLERSAELAPGLADSHLLRGMLLEEQGAYTAAEKAYRMALALRSDWGAVLVRLARILAAHPDPDRRKPAEALAMTEAMMQVGGEASAEIAGVHAMALAANGRHGEAIRLQSRLLEQAAAPGERQIMRERLEKYQSGETVSLPAVKED